MDVKHQQLFMRPICEFCIFENDLMKIIIKKMQILNNVHFDLCKFYTNECYIFILVYLSFDSYI
jgi:hypothetical protein